MNDIYDRNIYSLEFDVEFSSGLVAGAGSFGNRIQLARNGRGDFILHGTAIAGVLRHALYQKRLNDSDQDDRDAARAAIDKFFGSALNNTSDTDTGIPSLLKVDDVVISSSENQGSFTSIERTSHLRCRHTGSVAEGGLYSIEAIPPKTKVHFHLVLIEPNDFGSDTAINFLKEIAGLFHSGLVFGGNGNRGVGLANLVGDILFKSYDVTNLNGYASWLDDDYNRRSGKAIQDLQKLDPIQNENNTLKVTWNFIIPPGQDILISDGKGLDADSEPHRVTAADGYDYWLLPGSSLRGLLRNECSRLAAREGKKIADSVDAYRNSLDTTNPRNYGDNVGWLYQKDQKDDTHFINDIDSKYPVESMFGSLHKAGRLHISDALSCIGADGRPMRELAVDEMFPVQYRVHVAIDPISGGTIDGALFDNYVLTSGGGNHQVCFPVTMILNNPKEDEVRWLAQSLLHIDSGFLRVGSSKSAGRLVIQNDSLSAVGKYSEIFSYVNLIQGGDWTSVEPAVSNTPSEKLQTVTTDIAPKAENSSEKGILLINKKNNNTTYQVKRTNPKTGKESLLPVYKGVAFDEKDALNEMEVDIIVDKGQITKVTIPGKDCSSNQSNTSTNNTQNKPDVLGMPFHNPYTFIPFRLVNQQRKAPTLQTMDEPEKCRFSGTLEIELKTVSPMLVSEGWSLQDKDDIKNKNGNQDSNHKTYAIQKIGKDVIVPATGVRGFFRNLVTMITGGPLTVWDEETYLCQGRDLQLTPMGKDVKPILARVIEPGNSLKSGIIEIGETVLYSASELEKQYEKQYGDNEELPRPNATDEITWLWAEYDEEEKEITGITKKRDKDHTAQIKLSGKPIKSQGKREGVFVSPLTQITLSPRFWRAYHSRHQHGIRPELKKGDLIWIEPTVKGTPPRNIHDEKDISSLQWARWGRKGKKIDVVINNSMNPDSFINDGLVAQVTDLFGQVPVKRGVKGNTFKGRIISSNLVFKDGIDHLEKKVPLAVMATPHLGCIPFYRNNKDKLRGYKVYRRQDSNSTAQPPWLFSTQGIYDESGRLKSDPQQNCNITADLLNEGQTGMVTLSLRSLSDSELTLILYLCQNIWRLGGGKPLGLGACEVIAIRLKDDQGNSVDPSRYKMEDQNIINRFRYWKNSQKPVKLLRYPRAVCRNSNKNVRGGMTWFQKCAALKKVGDGLASLQVENLGNITGQVLPFLPDTPENEFLYGYDAFFCDKAGNSDSETIKQLEKTEIDNNQYSYPAIVQFDESEHISGSEQAGQNTSANRNTRNERKNNRE